jgi:hypothetical protein
MDGGPTPADRQKEGSIASMIVSAAGGHSCPTAFFARCSHGCAASGAASGLQNHFVPHRLSLWCIVARCGAAAAAQAPRDGARGMAAASAPPAHSVEFGRFWCRRVNWRCSRPCVLLSGREVRNARQHGQRHSNFLKSCPDAAQISRQKLRSFQAEIADALVRLQKEALTTVP